MTILKGNSLPCWDITACILYPSITLKGYRNNYLSPYTNNFSDYIEKGENGSFLIIQGKIGFEWVQTRNWELSQDGKYYDEKSNLVSNNSIGILFPFD